MVRPRRRRRPRGKNGQFVSYSHRTHPAKRNKPPAGTCTWCLLPIFNRDGTKNNRRTFCSPRCVTNYKLRADPKVMRWHVFFRDEGKCAACGHQHFHFDGKWEADHIDPLAMAFGDWAFWEPENVQILCTDPCHKQKSAADLAKYGSLMRAPKLGATPKKRVRLADRLR